MAEDVAADGASQDAGGSSEAGFGPAAAQERTAQPRPGRRKAAAGAGESAFQRRRHCRCARAWAAANSVIVSPRGRIKDEVIEAYRAAGN